MSEPRCACDVCGPDENTMLGRFTELHRAMHDFGRVVLDEWQAFAMLALVAWLVIVGATFAGWIG